MHFESKILTFKIQWSLLICFTFRDELEWGSFWSRDTQPSLDFFKNPSRSLVY